MTIIVEYDRGESYIQVLEQAQELRVPKFIRSFTEEEI